MRPSAFAVLTLRTSSNLVGCAAHRTSAMGQNPRLPHRNIDGRFSSISLQLSETGKLNFRKR